MFDVQKLLDSGHGLFILHTAVQRNTQTKTWPRPTDAFLGRLFSEPLRERSGQQGAMVIVTQGHGIRREEECSPGVFAFIVKAVVVSVLGSTALLF